MCSTWLPTVLGEITSRSAIALLDRQRATSLSTSTSRAVSPAGPSRRRGTRWPAAASTASTAPPPNPPPPAPPAKRPRLDLGVQLGGRLRGGPGRPVRARLAHGLVGVGGAQHA